MQFSEVSTLSDGYGGSVVEIRNKSARLTMIPTDDNTIEIRDGSNMLLAEYKTDNVGGDKTLTVASHKYINVREA